MDPLPVGEKSPKFHLPSTYARILDTKDFLGKKNVLFVLCPPADSDEENTAYLKRLRDRAAEIREYDTEIIGVSPSNQRYQSIFAYRNNLPFTFLIDEHKDSFEDFNALAEDGSVVPTTYLLDRESVVRMAERGFPSVDDILETLTAVEAEA